MKIKKVFIILLLFVCYNICFKFDNAVTIKPNSSEVTVGQTITFTVNFGYNVGAYQNATFSCNGSVIKSDPLWYIDANSKNGISTKTYVYTPTSAGIYNFSFSANGVVTIDEIQNGTVTANCTVNVKDKPKTNNVQPNNNTSPTQNNQINNTSNTNKNTVSNSNNKSSKSNNSNTYLSKLQVDKEGLTPNFNKNKTSYSITVREDVSSLNITAVPEVSTSKVSISGNTDLKVGDNKIYVTVTAESGSKRVYTITVTKASDPVKSNSYLLNLIVENATLSPEFSKEIFEYDCGTVGAGVENLKILTFGENENVKVEITGNDKIVEGENTINIKVTSEDETTTKNYIIKVKKDSSIVEENEIEEINFLEGEITKPSFFKKLINNWLIIVMYILIVVEFVEIVYLYRRQNVNNIKKEKKAKSLDEEFKEKQKVQKNLSKRRGKNKFFDNDEK